jgi:histidine ammonia-lyase
VYYKGVRRPAGEALKELGWKPLRLQAKEGLALLNGTQFMGACGVQAVLEAKQLADAADITAALSCDAFDCHTAPFHARIQDVRPHAGQAVAARNIRALREGGALAAREKTHVQDPYAFRCIPQVHGASRDAIGYAAGVVGTEVNAVTDNPTFFPEEDLVLSAGNFHGQPLALAFDFLALALAELGSIAERRTFQLLSGQRGLPPFLAKNPGLHSGLMIPQYTAAALASQNKQLCTPASADSIVSSNGQEDHVSMGANAALKLLDVVENTRTILAIEWMTAAQAMEFRRPLSASAKLEGFLESYRRTVPALEEDRVLAGDMAASAEFLSGLNLR